MKASLLYRISSILLLLFAAGHTLGFRQTDPAWGVDSLVQSMKSIHFNVNGSNRTYWDFFLGFGLFVTVLLVFASIVAWQLGSLKSEALAAMRVSAWGFVVCFAVVLLCRGRVPVLAVRLPHPTPVFDCHSVLPGCCRVAFRKTLRVMPRG